MTADPSGFSTAASSFAGDGHDHDHCITDAVAGAERLCKRRGVRLTEQRRRVLELVWQSHTTVGAYDLMALLGAEGGRPVAPPTVYRALDFLLAQGLIHRVESLNAYVGCARPAERHSGQFLICQDCGAAAEVHDPEVEGAIRDGAARAGFLVASQTVEVRGRCPRCQEAGLTDA